MKTNLGIELNDADLRKIGVALTGKAIPATRKQVTAFVLRQLHAALSPTERPTELRNFVCPKCSKPIALAVPIPKSAPTPEPVKIDKPTSPPQSAALKAWEKSLANASQALDQLATASAKLKELA